MSDDKKEKMARITEMERQEALHHAQQEHTKRVVAEAEKVVAQINAALAEQDRLFARHNITREQMRDFLKRIGGEKLEREVREKLAALQKESQLRADAVLQRDHDDLGIPPRPRRLRSLI